MLTIPTTKHLYFFEELNDGAKDNAAKNEIECMFYEDMRIILEEEVDAEFPNSTIEAQYSFSACQGDGLNLYGDIALNDLVHFATGFYLDHDEADSIMLHFPANHRYTYSLWDQRDYYDTVKEALEDYIAEYGPEDVEDYEDKITDAMYCLCDRLYAIGYDVIGGYYNTEHYEGMLFDEYGAFEGYTWDYNYFDYATPAYDGPDSMQEVA